MDLETYIRNEIRHNGPMDMAAFMGLAAGHYYSHTQPFGAGGDFITAPEISQMFGELLGAWAADLWLQMGQPPSVTLAECGPGRGTLMADALRATKGVPGFHAALDIHLIETSAALQEQQAQALKGYDVAWRKDLSAVPDESPLILLANEFLDALPVRQFQVKGGEWHERVVGLGDEEELEIGLTASAAPEWPIREGAVAEVSPAREQFARDVAARLARQGGAALFVDYGYEAGYGDTLQAVKAHEYCDILAHIGQADITAHVDFAALAQAAEGATAHGPVTQGAFLQALGIGPRAAALKQKASAAQAQEIDTALHRLTAQDEMGALFKAMAFSDGKLQPAGFR